MNKGLLLLAGLLVLATGAAFLFVRNLTPEEEPKPPPVAEKPVEKAPPRPEKMLRDGNALIGPRVDPDKTPPRDPPKKAEPPPKELPSDFDVKESALVGLEVQDPTSAELTEAKVPEGMTGVVVKNVDPASPAAEARIEVGDVIVRAQRDKITSAESLRAAVGDREHTVITVYRNGYPFQVVLHKPFHGSP